MRNLSALVPVIQMILKFVLPLGTVYYAEYFINQGLVSEHPPRLSI